MTLDDVENLTYDEKLAFLMKLKEEKPENYRKLYYKCYPHIIPRDTMPKIDKNGVLTPDDKLELWRFNKEKVSQVFEIYKIMKTNNKFE